jgi:hypothetical protein
MVVGKQVCQARAGSKLVVRRAPTSCLVQPLESSPTMKLTPELLAQAPSALNPVKERQLDLRGKSTENLCCRLMPTSVPGYKIPAIENLGVTKVAYYMIPLAVHIGEHIRM